MNRWYTQTLPSRSGWAIFLGIVAGLDAIAAALFTSGIVSGRDRFGWMASPFLLFAGITLVAGTAMLGGRRFSRFPADKSRLQKWLAQTPWTAKQRLPFGPWYPVWQDFLPVGGLSLLTGLHSSVVAIMALKAGVFRSIDQAIPIVAATIAAPVLAFFVGWVIVCFCCVAIRWPKAIVFPIAGLGVCLQIGRYVSPVAAVVVAAITLPIGVGLMIRRVKQILTDLTERSLELTEATTPKRKLSRVYDYLQPVHPGQTEAQREVRTAIVPVVAIGYCYLTLFPWTRLSLIFPLGLAVCFALVRVLTFHTHLACHLTPAARWATRKFVVPEYDRVWLPSIAMVVVAAVFVAAGLLQMLPINIAASLGILVPLAIGMLVGPNWDEWMLASPGAFRQTAGPQNPKHSKYSKAES